MVKEFGYKFIIKGNKDAIGSLNKIELSLKDVGSALRQNQKLQKEYAENPKALKGLQASYGALKKRQFELRQESRKLNKEIRDQVKAYSTQKKELPIDSLEAYEQQLKDINRQLRQMSKADLDGGAGKKLIAQQKALEKQVSNTESKIGKSAQSFTSYKRAVIAAAQGNGTLIGNLKGATMGMLRFAGPAAAAAAAGKVLHKVWTDGTRIAGEYEEALDKLSSITGLTGEEFDRMEAQVTRVATATKKGGTEVANAFGLIGSAAPELLKAPEALAEVTEQVIILSRASGSDLAASAETLTKTMNIYGLATSDAAMVTDLFATAQQKGTARADELAESIKEAGPTARGFNIDLEESLVILQGFAKGGVEGSKAGIGFRNVLSRLARTGKDEFNPAIVGGIQAIRNLRDANLPYLEQLKIFGDRNVNNAKILIDQIPLMDSLEGKLNDVGNAQAQANTNVDNAKGAAERAKASYENMLLAFNSTTGVFTGIKASFNNFKANLFDTIGSLAKGETSILSFFQGLTGIGQLTGRTFEDTNRRMQLLRDGIAENEQVATGSFGKAREALGDFFYDVQSIVEYITDWTTIQELLNTGMEMFKMLLANIPNPFEWLRDTVQDISEYFQGDLSENLGIVGTALEMIPNPFPAIRDVLSQVGSKLREAKDNVMDFLRPILKALNIVEGIRKLATKARQARIDRGDFGDASQGGDTSNIDATTAAQNNLNKAITAEAKAAKEAALERIQGSKMKKDALKKERETLLQFLESDTAASVKDIQAAADRVKSIDKEIAAIDARGKKRGNSNDKQLSEIDKLKARVKELNGEIMAGDLSDSEIAKRLIEIAEKENEIDRIQSKVADLKFLLENPEGSKGFVVKQIEDIQKRIDEAISSGNVEELTKAYEDLYNSGKQLNQITDTEADTQAAGKAAAAENLGLKVDPLPSLTPTPIGGLIDFEGEKEENKKRAKELADKFATDMKLELEDLERIEANIDMEFATSAVEDFKGNLTDIFGEEGGQEIFAAIQGFANTAQEALSGVFQSQIDGVDARRDAEIDSINEVFDARIAAAEGDKERQESLEKEKEAEIRKTNKKAAKEKQAIKIKEAIASAGVAIIQSLANTALPFPASLVAPAIIAAQTAVQIAGIKAQKFSDGGFTGPGTFTDGTGHKVAGIVHNDEYVSPTWQIKKHPQLFKELEAERVRKMRGFVNGGFTSSDIANNVPSSGATRAVVVQAMLPNQKSDAEFSDEQINIITSGITQSVGDALSGLPKMVSDAIIIGQDQSLDLQRRRELAEENFSI